MQWLVTLWRQEVAHLKPLANAPVFCAAAALLGYVVNLFTLPVFGPTELVFGSLFGVLTAVAFGPYAGGTVTAVAFLATWIKWGHPYGLIVYAMESWFIGWLVHRRRWSVLKAALVFWAGLGIPLTVTLIVFVWNPPFPSNWAIVFKYGANAAIIAFFAHALVQSRWFWRVARLPMPSLLAEARVEDQLLRGVVNAVVLPCLVFGVAAGAMLNRQQRDYLEKHLDLATQHVAEHVRSYLSQHQRTIEAIATALPSSNRDAESLQALLQDLRPRNSGFLTMLIANEAGEVIATSPERQIGSIADRLYFQRATMEGPAYVSPVFRGRGFGSDMIVAVSAAFMLRGERHVLQGSLNLQSLLESVSELPVLDHREALLFDQNNALVAHRRLANNEGEPPLFNQIPLGGRREIVVDDTVRGGGDEVERHYGTSDVIEGLGWTVYLREPAWDSVRPLARLYSLGAGALLALLVISSLLSQRFVRRMSTPFTRLVNYTSALVAGRRPPEFDDVDPHLPMEWQTLVADVRLAAKKLADTNRELNAALAERDLTAAELREFAGRLEERVAERTTELEKARRAAEHANQTKTEFLSIISHELRTPLNVALGHIHLLLNHNWPPLADDTASRVRKIKASTDHLLTLINDLLDLAKLEAGKVSLENAPVDVQVLCNDCAEFFHDEFTARKLTFTIEVSPTPLPLHADIRRLRQALFNLLSNAVKFTPPGGRVRLIAQPVPERGMMSFTVEDTGIGITPEQQQKLFRPFEQADRSFSRKYGGTGLGLSIVRHLVTLHGGSVEVASEPKRGSRFTLLFPLQPPKHAPADFALRP